MGFLERAIRRGISDGIGKAVGNAISQAIQPKVTEFADRTAAHLDNAAGNVTHSQSEHSGASGAFTNLGRAAQNFATKQAENLKICPSCESAASADEKFCQNCGAKLPEQTVAQSAVCTACGRQNAIGTKFCTECGAKLPVAVMEEESNARKSEEVKAQWREVLSPYPVWELGGDNPSIDEYDGAYVFFADFKGNTSAARAALEQYRSVARQNGFREAGQYPSAEHLYKMTDGVCYHIDFEHCFEGGGDCVSLGFMTGEPAGGFNYTKPEPEKPKSFRDIFNF